VVGKRFNAFAAEQWLGADGDGRDPAQARAFDAPCDRLGCVAALPEGESLSIVLDGLAFDEDCSRAEVVVSALSAPAGCKAKFLFDEQALARLGAVGLTWGDNGFALASDRSPTENRPWSPAPAPARDDRIVRPGHGASRGADPADVGDEPGEAR
jgi:competence protein ComEC